MLRIRLDEFELYEIKLDSMKEVKTTKDVINDVQLLTRAIISNSVTLARRAISGDETTMRQALELYVQATSMANSLQLAPCKRDWQPVSHAGFNAIKNRLKIKEEFYVFKHYDEMYMKMNKNIEIEETEYFGFCIIRFGKIYAEMKNLMHIFEVII